MNEQPTNRRAKKREAFRELGFHHLAVCDFDFICLEQRAALTVLSQKELIPQDNGFSPSFIAC